LSRLPQHSLRDMLPWKLDQQQSLSPIQQMQSLQQQALLSRVHSRYLQQQYRQSQLWQLSQRLLWRL
jgi:hypothetical protein